ncbi:MAG: ABC transporter substrate-binding protein [Spirochaetaceae bacterium]|jgi:ABC-type Fe3+ transport system substrate-binding protein|nr:ABC transporter substrate-binding protein [Spirochaetaceae bacterium]
MKKNKPHRIVPDNERPELDFLGRVFCPFKESFGSAWREWAESYNKTHTEKLRIAVQSTMKDDVLNDISTITDMTKFPSIDTEGGYEEFFKADFLDAGEKLALFKALPLPDKINPVFNGLRLRDPKGIFTIYGAMPYVLLVNHKRLHGRPVPRRISDLTKPEYSALVGSVYAINDITELLLLEIWKEQGEAGIRALGRNISFGGREAAIAEDAVSDTLADSGAAVYVLSWLAANSVPKRDYLEVIWPDDGAIFCPLYAIAKKETEAAQIERQKACADFLFSAELGAAMAEKYLVHINADVKDKTPPTARFRWVGWDYIYETPVEERVKTIEGIFNDEKKRMA